MTQGIGIGNANITSIDSFEDLQHSTYPPWYPHILGYFLSVAVGLVDKETNIRHVWVEN